MKATFLPLLVLGLGALSACDGPKPPLTENPSPDAKTATISNGASVDLEAFLPEQGWTVVEFGATW